MELQTLADKVSDIHDAMGRIETKLEELEDKMDDVESQLTANFEGMLDNIRSCIGDDIQSAVSDINSNIDRLKD
jgi:archaellum component FlaC|tara:strand:- start:58 stop:279 length:222 start_codon:yes stop_codon:yes gene_type:complete